MQTRHKLLLSMLDKGKIMIADTARLLKVSEMTLRRDLFLLEKQKKCLIVKGGAVKHPALYEPANNAIDNFETKNLLAQALYRKIIPSDVVFIGTGTTSLLFSKLIALQNAHPMTVITNSLSVASVLFGSVCKVILLGGELRSKSLDLVGKTAEKNIKEYHVNWLISGCDAANANYGFYTSDAKLSSLEKKSIGIADKTAIITESIKFGKRSHTRFASLSDVDLIVTDSGISEKDVKKIKAKKIEILIAKKR